VFVDDAIYVCVKPVGSVNKPYLIAFREFTLFGLLIPQESSVIIYGPNNLNLQVGLYSIIPDATTGGYRRAGNKGVIPFATNALDPACGQNKKINAGMISTLPIPIPATRDTAILIQKCQDNFCDTSALGQKDFLGVVALDFRPVTAVTSKDTKDLIVRDFQIIQMSDENLQISLPLLSANTRFVLISNKDSTEVGIQKSFPTKVNKDSDVGSQETFPEGGSVDSYLSQTSANARSKLRGELASEDVPLDLFQVMEEGYVRIYPNSGLVFNHPKGGSIRLNLSKVTKTVRKPAFVQGKFVQALEGSEASYFPLDRPTVVKGKLVNKPPSSVGKPAEIAANVITNDKDPSVGQLFINEPGTQNKVSVPAWLVEVIK
jgi:hypothetical protein